MTLPPVLLIVFNRPDTTEKVIDALRTARIPKLYVAADAPRNHVKGEYELSQQVKDLIRTKIDWDCEVHTLYQDQNLACKLAVTTAIDWMLEKEESGIILEDDCVPHSDFFTFCSELLEKYKDDERIMAISGNNFQRGIDRGDASYYFSRYAHNWGWATWRRAWKHYDPKMKGYDKFKAENLIAGIWGNSPGISKYWIKLFDFVNSDQKNIWDYIWYYAVWKNNGLTILPQKNLIQNIGFGESFTHENAFSSILSVKAEPLKITKHPDFVIQNREADMFFARRYQIRGFMKLYTLFKAKYLK